MRGLLLLLAVSAPAPLREPPARPPVLTPKTLAGFTAIHWRGEDWPVIFDDGAYCCTANRFTGRGSVWAGPARIDGRTVVVSESHHIHAPDAAPVYVAGPHEVRFELSPGEGGDWHGTVTGQGWGVDERVIFRERHP